MVSGMFGQSGSKIYFDHLTIKEGLSHNTVHCMAQDSEGYIWIGTQNGLNKFDGYEFEIYRSGEQSHTNFRGKTITAIFTDKAGNLWVGTNKGFINFKRRGSETFENWEQQFPKLKLSQVTAFTEDSKGKIWITTRFSGVLCFDPSNNSLKVFNKAFGNFPFQNEVFDVIEDSKGTIWIGTIGIGLNYLNKDSVFSPSHNPESNSGIIEGYRKKLFADGNDIWIATEGTGLYKMNIETQKLIRYSPDNEQFNISTFNIRGIVKTENNQIFAPSDGGGLNEIDLNTGTTKTHWFSSEQPASLNSNALISIMKDRTGNIWIGSFNGGVNLIKKNKNWFEWHTGGKGGPGRLAQSSILSIFETSKGEILIGTDGGGLSWMKRNEDGETFETFMHNYLDPKSISSNVVKTIFEDSKSRIWLGCYTGGLDLFDIEKKESKSYTVGNNIIWDILELPIGELLLGTLGNGLLTFDPISEKIKPYSEQFTEQQIHSIHFDKKNRLWIGTESKGLFLQKSNEHQFYHFQKNDQQTSLADNDVRDIFEDQIGTIWIGTEGGGISKFTEDFENPFQNYSKKEGLIANSVMGITQDSNNDIWVSTFEGLSKINATNNQIENFSFRTGENTNQFNQNSILKDQSGRLYFGGITGMHIIHPNNLTNQKQSSKIVFTGLNVFNTKIVAQEKRNGITILEKPIELAEEINLTYAENSFSIDFAQLNFTNPEQTVFEYKLEGFDEKWQIGKPGDHSAHYTNLDAGTFNFKVRNGKSESNIKVNIKPPFWDTRWFKALLLLVIGGLTLGIFQFILNRREAISKRKLLQAESEILRLKNANLETEVESKNSKLMFSSVQMAHKKEILSKIKDELAISSGDKTKIRQVINQLDRELEGEDYWKEFNLYFEQIDKNFLKQLQKSHPKLTKNDLRLCSLLRLNLSTKEIASILNISVRGVEQSRYRLKKRLQLDSQTELSKFILEF